MSNVVPFKPRKKVEARAVGECTDDELFHLLRESSREALSELCRRHMASVVAAVSDRCEVPDQLACEVWVTLWRERARQTKVVEFGAVLQGATETCLAKEKRSSPGTDRSLAANANTSPISHIGTHCSAESDDARIRSLTELVLLQVEDASSPKANLRVPAALILLLVGCLGVLFWLRKDSERSPFASASKDNDEVRRLARDVEVSVRLVSLTPRALLSGETVAPNARFVVTGRNADSSKKAHVIVFIREASGRVSWLVPRDEPESDDVASVVLPTSTEPVTVGSEFSASTVERGPSTLVTVVTTEPLATVALPSTPAEISRKYPFALVRELGFHVAE